MSQEGIRIGKPKVKPTALTHVCGVRAGNKPGSYEKEPGHLPDGRSTARRSTGINARARNAILPEMPNLSPA
ncbi:hypothetical protein [Geobacter sp. SVR]|uniref:hypothetical protein n=1 Tax=Geobacter sp. SVR TaxID=2495594 RepID=UPI00143EFA07|nr:hypothetical protein [Geobacter sp. SVR]BCS52536.1 hypothetical protein GSVR_08440 [Geobacter sp. SVR]GCF84027.1 hypothetical protein GSbR_06270 [Geobacter sp. SVR]